MIEDKGWGFYYKKTALKDDKIRVTFKGDYSIHAEYTINFLLNGTALYSAERIMKDFDAGSYTPLTKITLTMETLDEKLKSMEAGKSTEKDFRQFMESKKFN